jgi:hypothetical protein
MKPRMAIGARVIRPDAPLIKGSIVALAASRAKVYWSSHTTSWVDVTGLILIENPRKSHRSFPKVKPDVSENKAIKHLRPSACMAEETRGARNRRRRGPDGCR